MLSHSFMSDVICQSYLKTEQTWNIENLLSSYLIKYITDNLMNLNNLQIH